MARSMSLLASPKNLTTILGITIASRACQWKLLAIQKALMFIWPKIETRRVGATLFGRVATSPEGSLISISVFLFSRSLRVRTSACAIAAIDEYYKASLLDIQYLL